MSPIRVFDHTAQRRGGILLPLGLMALGAGACLAQSAEDLRLTVGKSIVIDYPMDIKQISTSNPDVVDASPVTKREILVNAKGLGASTMIVWNNNDQRTFYNVNVDLNLDPFRRLLQEAYPGERIEVRSSRDSITLNGTVSSKDVADRVTALATTFAKTVVSNLQIPVAPIEKQVLLRVKFAELDRQKGEQYGVNLDSLGATNTIGHITTEQFTGGGTTQPSAITDALSIFAFRKDLNLAAFIKALQTENILEILAEPTLVTSNGKDATFLVGGEFPVPVVQGGTSNGVTVQFREYGIRLNFTPVITANNTIKMFLKQEVSSIDLANAVTLNGFSIPALSTRRAETNVELSPGQSFVVAGLLDNRDTDTFSKIPFISSIPILGPLFKSKSESKSRTELVMLVTPELTEPLNQNDPKPEINYPRDFLKKLDPKDIPATKTSAKATTKK